MFNGSQPSSQHFLPHPVGPVTPSHKDSAQSGAVPFIGVSSSLRRLLLQAEITAPHLHIAALEGEAGTGKHLFAQTLHLHSELASHIFHRRDAREWLANETDISSLSGTLYLDRVDLLALTSLTPQDARDSVDLSRAVEQAINYLEQAIHESGAGITVGTLPRVLGNESQLTGLMQNLLGNAIKYRGPQPVRIEVTAEPMGTEWLVKVRDNGIGIAPAYHVQVFGLFKRLHQRSIPGTGIGLAICKKIVDGMGGRIWVESELGKGSTFCFTAQSAL